MDFYTKIKNRYSVREYDTSKEISQDDYNKIIDVINSAPNSSNWHSSSVIVVRDKNLLERLGATSKYTGAIKTCSMFLIFLADYNRLNNAQDKYSQSMNIPIILLSHILSLSETLSFKQLWHKT
ncbi:nitroreductase family protein [Mycoplasmopsis californica]|uniref:nitroreductase family protein n=1 Tax=Mycoplasmopsis californica TaxID=2113 RepID=UPI000A8A15D4|nr:nitroreductase family protein [Mycoplasmopsis californica]